MPLSERAFVVALIVLSNGLACTCDVGVGSADAADATRPDEAGTLDSGCAPPCGEDSGVPPAPKGHALWYDGLDDVVDCGSLPLGLPADTFTFEVWLKPEPDAWGTVFLKRSVNDVPTPYILWADFNPNWDFRMRFNWSTSAACEDRADIAASGAIMGTGSWRHVAVVHESTAAFWAERSVYVDGALVASGNAGVPSGWPLCASPDEVRIGGEVCIPDCYSFHGAIDDVLWWNTARTAPEVAADRLAPPPPGTPGLIARWTFDEGVGGTTLEAVSGTSCTLGTQPGADTADPIWTAEIPY